MDKKRISLGENAQGNVDVYDLGSFRLHVYNSNDVMADTSYVIEGKSDMVTMEEPLFKECVSEFGMYVKSLGKPVAEHIVDFHMGGTGSEEVVQPKDMHKFMREGAYAAMMHGFQKAFGDKMVDLPTGKADEVAFGTTEIYAGVPFTFNHGPACDFPGANILIDGKVYYSHWAPFKAHVSHLQISSRQAIDDYLKMLADAKATGAVLYIGGHGGAWGSDAVDFKMSYLEKMKQLLTDNKDADSFVQAMKAAYPELPGADGLPALADALYK